MTKAAIKREKQLREKLTSVLANRLIDFKDLYLTSYVNWSKESIRNRVEKLKESHGKPFKVEGRFAHSGIINNSRAIEALEFKLSRDMILTLEFINEANEGYNNKIQKLIEKLVKAEIDIYQLRVEKIGDVGSDFAFLVSDNKVEVHARVIFANGCFSLSLLTS